jgi:nicotinamide-nucleotide amidase
MEKTMRAEIITIGDELLIGQVVDTNSAWIAEHLNVEGIQLHQITSVHDNREHILKALSEAFSRADIILTTGGLGPTKDDITKHVLCEYFSTQLIENVCVREHIHELYKDRPEALNRLTATQWMVPECATILPNRVGSAPIMVFEKTTTGEADLQAEGRSTAQRSKLLITLPGVPHEMKIAMTEQVLPFFRLELKGDRLKAGNIFHKTILLSGIPESKLAILIEDWENALPSYIHLAYLPKDGIIRLRLSSYGDATETDIQAQIDKLLPLIHDYVLATEDLPLELLAGRLLKQHNLTISTAESCTGGRLAATLNAQSGSSAYYMGSVVAYDNNIKTNVLGVSKDVLQNDGAVSEICVMQMAEGVRQLMHTDYAIATSGIAGPTGGTVEKPVGTIWIAWATPQTTQAKCFHFGSAREREQITQRAVTEALVHLIQILKQ